VTDVTFSQAAENTNKKRLIIKLKSKPSIDFKNFRVKQRFNHKELDIINKKNKVKSINLSKNKKQRDTYILNFESNQDINHLINLYIKTNLFEYVEADFIGFGGGKQMLLETIPDNTYFSRQYGLYNNGVFSLSPATNDEDIDMELGWDIEQGDQSIIIAILDEKKILFQKN